MEDLKLTQTLDISSEKNVYVVGDLHGCYSLLMEKLSEIGFNKETDVLISVGDLVDRGDENMECISLLDKEWFYAVRGNHEQFCIDGKDDYNVSYYHKMRNNGGAWFYEQDEITQGCIVEKFKQIPILLTVRYKGKKFGFAHGDVPYQDWELLNDCVERGLPIDGRDLTQAIMWSRTIVDRDEYVDIAQVDNIFLGHTVLTDGVKQIGNCTFLDTGAVFQKVYPNNCKLTVLNLNDYL